MCLGGYAIVSDNLIKVRPCAMTAITNKRPRGKPLKDDVYRAGVLRWLGSFVFRRHERV